MYSQHEKYFFFEQDLARNYTFVSQSICDMLGYAPDYFIAKYNEIILDTDINNEASLHQNLLLSGVWQKPYELDVVANNKKQFKLEISANPKKNPQGEIVGIEGIAYDITQNASNATELNKRKNEIAGILQTTLEGFVLVNSENIIIEANDVFCNMLHKHKEFILGKKLIDFFPAEEQPLLEKHIVNLQAGAIEKFQLSLGNNEESTPCLISARPFLDGYYQNNGFFCLLTAISTLEDTSEFPHA